MKKYEKEVIKAQLDHEKQVLKDLEKNYKEALLEIDSRIAQLLGRGDSDMQHVVYQVEFQKALRKQIETILDQLHNNEFETITEYLTACYEEGFIGELYCLQEQGIPLVFPVDQEQVVAAVQHETKLKESLYTRLGKDVGELKKQIAGEISRGISTGMMYDEISRNLAGYAGINRNKAATIVRTESHRIQVKAAENAIEKAKKAGADIVEKWDATLDGKTRPHHRELDGKLREDDGYFHYSGGRVKAPSQFGIAAEDINCRCRLGSTAKWLLDVEETKYLGNTKKMTDKQLQPIADKLHIDVEELKKYSDQIIPVKAKDFDDFRRQYEKIWNAKPVEKG